MAATHCEPDRIQRVLHSRLSEMLGEVTLLHQYGAAYVAIRQAIIMQKACAVLGFKLGHKKDTPVIVAGLPITQADLIKYFSFGTGNTFWNSRSVYALAVRARDFIEQIDISNRQAHQTDSLHIIRHMLDSTMLSLPTAPGSASSASSISRPVFESRCADAIGANTRPR